MGLVRLFLALVVAGDHWRVFELPSLSPHMDDRLKLGFNSGHAVLFFYVISGFLITYTLSHNYSRDSSGVRKFYRQRFIRIFSLYWPMVLLSFVLIDGAWTRFLGGSLADKLTGLLLIGMDWNIAFSHYPDPNWGATITALQQAWTLGAELTFYILAPFLLRSWRIGLLVLAASFGTRAAIVMTLGTDLHDVWTYQFIATTFGFFLLGQLACIASQKYHFLLRPHFWPVMLLAAALAMTFGGSYVPFDGRRLWMSVSFFTLSLPGLFQATKRIRWMNAVGNLSYPVYLVHTLALLLFGEWLLRTIPATTVTEGYYSIALFLAVAVGVAAAVHYLFEVPLARLMHAHWLRTETKG